MRYYLTRLHKKPTQPKNHYSSSSSSSSSTSNNKPIKWNSTTNVVITNPTLLIMESCTCMRHLKQIQASMTSSGLITHTFPVSRVLAFCALADSGDIDHAHVLFTHVRNPNTYMWNVMIRGYVKARNPTIGFSFFRRMVRDRIEMDCRSFVFVLKGCEQFPGFLAGKAVHCVIWKLGYVSVLLVLNGLIHFYASFGCVEFARKVFDACSVRDVVSWTSMIHGYAAYGCWIEALKLFDVMLSSDVEPNEVTMIAVLLACSQSGESSFGKHIHEYIQKKNIKVSLKLQNAILDMYLKCGCLSTAREIFDNMESKDVFSWTSMINGYAKFGDLHNAKDFFDKMPARNVVSWNAMIAGYSQNNKPNDAINLFHEMLKANLVPSEDTLVCVISACGQLDWLDLGRWIHNYYINERQPKLSVTLVNAFIDMYAKCGDIETSAKIFNQMTERNLVTWNSIIGAYASHGRAYEALALFEQMKSSSGIKPDEITIVGVLSACTHAGLISQGREIFKTMESNFGIQQKGEHYACMIDLLGRNGLLAEAYELLKKMPMKPNEAAWGALLNACRMHGNVELAKFAGHELLKLDPEDSGIYVILANICAKGKSWGDVQIVRSTMREKGIRKTPGCSLIVVDGEFHEFLAADKSHPRAEEMYRVLDCITYLSKLKDTP